MSTGCVTGPAVIRNVESYKRKPFDRVRL